MNPPLRWLVWIMLPVRLLNMFVVGILARERGLDPPRAAAALDVFAPGGCRSIRRALGEREANPDAFGRWGRAARQDRC